MFIDADPWTTMDIFDSYGRMIYRATNRGSLAKQGGTELFLESGEPKLSDVPLAVFLKRFPQGKYRMVGKGLNGEKLIGTAKIHAQYSRGAGAGVAYRRCAGGAG